MVVMDEDAVKFRFDVGAETSVVETETVLVYIVCLLSTPEAAKKTVSFPKSLKIKCHNLSDDGQWY